MKILVVEDDRKVAGFIEQGLREEGYVVDVAPDGDEALMLAHVYEYDIILLDIVLPKKNGFQVAIELRREGRNTPILMLTSRDAVEDVVRGLDAGADDYLAKPFQFDELLARIRALHRRGGAERLEVLRYGPITLDRLRHVALINDRKLDLTPKEFQLLEYFLLHPEEVVRRTTLLEKVWDMHFDPESNVVDVHVGNLRRKLAQEAGEQLLSTVRGVGFSLRRNGQTEASAEHRADRPGRRRAPGRLPALHRRAASPSGTPPAHAPPCCSGAPGSPSPAHPVVWSTHPRRAPRGTFAADLVASFAIVGALLLGRAAGRARRRADADGGRSARALRRGPRLRGGAGAGGGGAENRAPAGAGRA